MSARELRLAGASLRRRLARLSRPPGLSERLLRSDSAWVAPLEPVFGALVESPFAVPLPGGELVRESADEPVRSQAFAGFGDAGRGRAGDPVPGRGARVARGPEQGRARLPVLPVAPARRQSLAAVGSGRSVASAAALGASAEPEPTSPPAVRPSAQEVRRTPTPELPPAAGHAAGLGRVRALEPLAAAGGEHCRSVVQLGELVLAAERALGARLTNGVAAARARAAAELSAERFSPEQLAQALVQEPDDVSVAPRAEAGATVRGVGVGAGALAGAAAAAAVAPPASAATGLPGLPGFLLDPRALRSSSSGLPDGELAERINDVLREQARRQGVDLV